MPFSGDYRTDESRRTGTRADGHAVEESRRCVANFARCEVPLLYMACATVRPREYFVARQRLRYAALVIRSRAASACACASSQLRKVAIFGRSAVTLGQTM